MTPSPLSSRWKYFFICLSLLYFAIPTRLWHLTQSPPVIVDEPANIRDIDLLLATGEFRPVDFEWGFGQATLVHYPTVLLIRAGITDKLYALRLTSVILSILALVPFFFIVKRYTSLFIAWCATLLFSSSYYYLQFSRVGWTNIHALCFGLYFLWVSDEAARKRSWILTGISGVLAGILFYTYRAAEVFIVFGAIRFFIVMLFSRGSRRIAYSLILLFISITSIIAYPWIHKISQNWEKYTLRSRVVSVFRAAKPYHGLTTNEDILKYQITQTIRSWIVFAPMQTDAIENPRYLPNGYSILSPGAIILFWIGLVVALYQIRYFYPWLVIYAVGLYAGQVLTVDPPNGSRALIVLPIIYLFIGLGLNTLFTKLPSRRLLLTAILGVISIGISLYDIAMYVGWMSWITLK